jgi:uncharacterized Zn finger protein
MVAVTHPRLPARRAPRGTWWSKAWLRSVEEAAFAVPELRRGRSLARAGSVGQITVDAGSMIAAVHERDDVWTVTCTVPVLDEASVAMLVELVAAASGRLAALMSGDLPLSLVEEVEEAGVELLPYGGELGSACTCDAWADPCPHALAVLTQVAWLIGSDPFVLLALRGLPRDELLARLHARTVAPGGVDPDGSADPGDPGDPDLGADLDLGLDAAQRAARLLAEVSEAPDDAAADDEEEVVGALRVDGVPEG